MQEAGPTGFEPAFSIVTGLRGQPLPYGPIKYFWILGLTSTRGGIRTHDLIVMSDVL